MLPIKKERNLVGNGAKEKTFKKTMSLSLFMIHNK